MLILGRILFYVGVFGLAFQMFESWLEMTGLPITSDNLFNAMLWWTGCAAIAAVGLFIKKKHGDE
jgi:hypothetical protein